MEELLERISDPNKVKGEILFIQNILRLKIIAKAG